jgi:hypothetical protein
MALVLADRVQVTTSTTGTGTLTLGSALDGFQDFSVIGDGNTTYYTITSGNNWEVGIGTYTASGTTLSRDTILDSSNGGSAINLSGTSNVFVTYPAGKNVNSDDIGVTVQAYDVDTAKYDDTTANFIGTLQNGGSNVLVDTDIGSTVQAFDSDTTKNDVVNTFTTNQIIDVSTTDPALRVTQRGAGDAFIVEDSTNPDATPFVIDASGKVGIGTSSPASALDVNGTVTATTFSGSLSGNATTTTTLETARTINGTSFDGSSNITITAVNPNALTIGTGLSGTSYDGSGAVTVANTGVLSNVAGTGISVSNATGDVTITNTAPDQTVSLTGAGATSISGTYPNFTITSTDVNTTYTAGTGLDLTGTVFSIDSTVATLTGTQTLTNKTISGANNTLSNVSLTTAVTGTLPVDNGGTGLATLTANNLLAGNGTGTVNLIAPSTSGNIIRSNGTAFESVAPIASQAEAEAGTNNTQYLTPLRLREGVNATGTAPIYAARAWVNFDGTTATPSTISGSGNVSSITRNTTGNYTVNFTTAMPDANYTTVVTTERSSGAQCTYNTRQTGSVKVFTYGATGSSGVNLPASVLILR